MTLFEVPFLRPFQLNQYLTPMSPLNIQLKLPRASSNCTGVVQSAHNPKCLVQIQLLLAPRKRKLQSKVKIV
jgi:hypothetical protein